MAVRPGGILIAGMFHGSRYGAGVGYVRELDPAGDVLWSRTIGAGNNDVSVQAMTVVPNAIYVAGTTWGKFPGQPSTGVSEFLMKLGPDGTKRWVREFGGPAGGAASDVYAAGRSIYVAGDRYSNDAERAEVRRYDPRGRLRWSRLLHTQHATSITARGGAVYVGSTTYSPRFRDSTGHLQRFDSAGNEIWSRTVPRFVPDVETAPGVVYATGGAIRAFAPADGTPQWSYVPDAFLFKTYIQALDLADGEAYFCGNGRVAGDPIEHDDSFLAKVQFR